MLWRHEQWRKQRQGNGNGRNGYGRKTVLTETGKLELEIPPDWPRPTGAPPSTRN